MSFDEFYEKRKGQKVVFTNGCFDILHRGHVHYLNEAKSHGDILVLGLNSDESIKELKGDQRPINKLEDRKYILENLRSIDFVFPFYELTPLKLIMQLKPDLLVKGGDWEVESIVGAKEVISWGGEVKSLSFVNNLSTTSLIDKIKND